MPKDEKENLSARDLKEMYGWFNDPGKEMFTDLGFDVTVDTSHIEEDEITYIIKLKK